MRFTYEELKELYCDKKLSTYQIAKLKGVSHTTVRYWLKKYGIRRRTYSEVNKLRENAWTDEEIEKLKKMYPVATKKELLKTFPNRTWSAIVSKAHKLGLKKVERKLPPLNGSKLKETEKAYIAGFLDGEGTITISKATNKTGVHYLPVVQLANTNEKVMKWLCEKLKKLNISFSFLIDRPKKKNWKECYIIIIREMESIRKFLYEIKDYLIVKRTQAELLLEFVESRLKKIHYFDGYNTYTEREKEIIEKIRKMNSRKHRNREHIKIYDNITRADEDSHLREVT